MDFGNIFSRAWRICWDNKYLFILGFLAALGSAGSNSSPQANYSFRGEELPPAFLENLDRLAAIAFPVILALVCFLFLLGLILWLVRLTAQAGLISAAVRIDGGEKVSFGQAFSAGTGYLLRFVGLNLLIYLPFLLLGLVFAVVGIAAFGAAIGSAIAGQAQNLEGLAAGGALIALCVLGLICLLIPLWAILTVVYAFAQRAVVGGNLGVMDSVGRSWRLIRQNVGDVVVLVVLLVVLSFVFTLLVGAILVPVGLLVAGPTFVNLLTNQAVDVGDVLLLLGGGIILGIIAAILNSILITFRSVAVTLAYQDMAGKEAGKVAAQVA